jgi:predicted dehydrogenase
MDDSHLRQDQNSYLNQPLGLGLIGAGAFGSFCLQAFIGMEEISVVAVADIDESTARAVAPQGTQVYSDLDQLLEDENVDIVAINTPPYLHGDMIISAAEAGKHIFVEKPLAISFEEAQRALKTVRKSGVQLSIDYVLRQHPLHRLAAKVIRSQALGQFQHWSLENFATDENLPADHWFWDQSKSGGIHVEHGVHFFDLCNHFAGRAPSEVSGFEQHRPDGRIDRVGAVVRYGEAVLASFYHCFNQLQRGERTTIHLGFSRGQILLEGWIPTRLTLHGFVTGQGEEIFSDLFTENIQFKEKLKSEGILPNQAEQNAQTLVEVSATKLAPDRQMDYQKSIQAGVRNLVAAIRGEQSLEVTAENGLLSLAIALQARENKGAEEFIPPDGGYSI